MKKLVQQIYAAEQYVKSLFWVFVLILPFSYLQFHVVQSSYALVDWVIPIIVALIFGIGMGFLSMRSEVHKKERAIFKAVVDFSLEFTFVRNVEGKYEFVSPAVEELTGYSPDDFYNTPNFMDAIVHPEDRCDWSSHVHNVNEDGKPEKVELRIVTKQGEVRWLEHLCGPVHNSSGEIIGVRSTNIDITERKLAAKKVERLGFYDPLTDLPNRRYLNDYMSQLIIRSEQRDADEKFAVFFVDLNRFKYVNDAHGHSIGDQLLKEVARRFRTNCLESKKAMIARFGGDEFVFVTKHWVETESIQDCVAQMNLLLEAPFRIQGYKLSIGVTAGVAVYPQDGLTPEILIKNADAAMYKAKSQGLSMAFFSHEMTAHATEMVDLQSRLRGALNRGLIKPYYQPLIDLKTGKTMGVEVLARWVTDDGSIGPSPAVFIPVAEETGLIWALSEAMIAQAGNEIVRWQQEGVQMKYSINVSARQFADDNFCNQAIA
ncbi:MAG: diguanylate cyclase, partial [Pseudomonadota bacterium]|nr:diguanylate cyclase [Pseudomonadota bacterium]